MGVFSERYQKYKMFIVPLFILLTLIAGGILRFVYSLEYASIILFIMGIIPGALQLISEAIDSLRHKSLAIDYIAILAILVSIISGQYLVGGVIALMVSSGAGLEKFAQKRARSSLTALSKRIPDRVVVWLGKDRTKNENIDLVKIGQKILVRTGEVIPLDGHIHSEEAQIDESTLTGEPYFVDKKRGDNVRSGTVNMGPAIIVHVTKKDADSTYRQIINLVENAQNEKPAVIRAAHRYNVAFTIISLLIALFTYIFWGSLYNVLAVLVIATPCPLLIAAPVALIGGMSASARKKIIIKDLEAIELTSRADTLVFDKTGTITLGKPLLKDVKVIDKSFSRKRILGIAAAIERNSLHPYAHSIISQAKKENARFFSAKDVREIIGNGISGSVAGKKYTITKAKDSGAHNLAVLAGNKKVAEIVFEDVMKRDAKPIIRKLESKGMSVYIFTGDKKEGALAIKKALGGKVKVRSQMTPEDKQRGIKTLKAKGRTIIMIGDGINDAPALALADVGMVFSHAEHTASSEAADIVFMGGSFSEVNDSISISSRTMRIAKQSMIVGISLSIVGMLFASFGFIVPVIGAVLQEVIDVSVIINSLRALWLD